MTWEQEQMEAEARGKKQGLEEGLEQGNNNRAMITIQNMYKDGLTVDTIVKYVDVPLEFVEKVIAEMK